MTEDGSVTEGSGVLHQQNCWGFFKSLDKSGWRLVLVDNFEIEFSHMIGHDTDAGGQQLNN